MQPTQLTVRKDRRTLEIKFGDKESYELSAEILRVLSPSAEVQGHSPDQRKIIGGKRNVEILELSPVGNYAVRITFDDMHSTGIYTWKFLRELGLDFETHWSNYLNELNTAGLNRDTPGQSG